MLRGIATILILCYGSGALAAYNSAPGKHQLSYVQLKELIKNNKIKTIDELFLHFKASKDRRLNGFTKSPAYVHTSDSSNQNAISVKFPRGIAFNGNLTMSITGNPDFPDEARQLEIQEHNPETGELEFHLIEFPTKDELVKNPDTEANPIDKPDGCFGCHQGQSIWAGYAFWPKSMDVGGPNALDEKADKRSEDWHTRRKDLPRYAVFDGFSEDDASSNLTQHLADQNHRRIALRLSKNPPFEGYEASICSALSLVGHKPTHPSAFIPLGKIDEFEKRLLKKLTPEYKALTEPPKSLSVWKALLAETTALQTKNFTDRLKRANESLGTDHTLKEEDLTFGAETLDNIRIAALRYIMEGAGVDVAKWEIPANAHEVSYVFSTPSRGEVEIAEAIAGLLKKQGKAVPAACEEHLNNWIFARALDRGVKARDIRNDSIDGPISVHGSFNGGRTIEKLGVNPNDGYFWGELGKRKKNRKRRITEKRIPLKSIRSLLEENRHKSMMRLNMQLMQLQRKSQRIRLRKNDQGFNSRGGYNYSRPISYGELFPRPSQSLEGEHGPPLSAKSQMEAYSKALEEARKADLESRKKKKPSKAYQSIFEIIKKSHSK